MSIKITASLEDYLETIFHLVDNNKTARAIDISKNLNVGKSSVTEALRSLSDKKLINYTPYSSITLTHEGEYTAKKIIHKHKTLHSFFKDILGIEDNDAKENACKVEHVISGQAFEKLVCFMEFIDNFSENKTDLIEIFRKYCKDKEA